VYYLKCVYTHLLQFKKAKFSHSSYTFPKEELLEPELDQPFIFYLFLGWLVGWLVGSPTFQRVEINFVIYG